MNNILMRFFTVLMLIFFNMGAKADVKVLYGENGTEKFEGTGGSIKIELVDSKVDKTKVTVYLTFIPQSGYTFEEKTLEVYAVISPSGAPTRAPEISGDPLKLTEEKTDISSAKRYSVDIDSKLALWVKKATFTNSEEAKNRSDLSGYYYLAFPGKVDKPSNGYNAEDPANNYYLCPTEDYLYYQATDQCTTTDNGQPFLTTYTCKDGVYDADNAVWQLIKHTNNGQDYYYIKHVIDNKYLIYNGKIAGNRLRAHLESTTSPGANALFKITEDATYPGYYYFAPNGVNSYWLNLTEGNYPNLDGQPGKNDGPTVNGKKYNVNGTLGGWTEANNTSQIHLETVSVNPPTFTVNADGTVEMSTTTANTTIYYTTDGANPKTADSKNTYSDAISLTNDMGTAIKAYAVDNTDNTKTSVAVTFPLATYTYKIINKSNRVVIETTVKQAVGTPLSSEYTSIPEAIRSSYISDETVNFYSFSDTYNVGDEVNETTISRADPIKATPTEGTNIYITYTTNHLGSKFLHLQGVRPLNIKREDGGTYKYLYDNNGTLTLDASPEASITTNSHLWYIKGATTPDPYDVIIQNSPKTLYLTYSSSELSLNAEACTYILLNNSSVDTDHEDITLKRLSDGTTFSIRVNPVEIPTSYYLIDKAGKIIFGPKESASSNLAVPSEWESPLVSKYHYWKVGAFDEEKRTAGDPVYELIQDPAPTEIKYLTDLTAGEHIYVTYDVDPSFVFDTTDDDAVGSQAYMLRFTGGETFRQENGKDALMTTPQKAVYPYSNGDAMLFVYGTEQWNTQLSSGASTRTRWLWYVVSPDSDPYHVYIMSHQGQASSHSYFRTYAVEYGGNSRIVTGVTTKNSAAASEEPSEYMILKQNGNCKLVTLIGGVQHTVNSFEQYWKNNPVVQDMLDTKVAVLETYDDDITLNSTQLGELQNKLSTDLYNRWHSYQAFANAAPWVGWKTDNTGSGKQYKKKTHWFQTIDMGSTGEFIFEPTTLQPQVILIDNHGWEVMRVPMYTDSQMKVINTAALSKYDSPMVETYHWYPTSKKTDGYHKYTVSDQEITVYDSDRKATSDRYTHNSTTLADVPYTHIDSQYQLQDYRVKSDFYVTYTVKPEYASSYAGAAIKENTQASKYLVKQGDSYAKISGNTMATETTQPDINSVPEDMQWYVRPNFDIDKEMGYQYDVVKVDTRDEDGNVLTSHVADETETNEDYVTAGKHGFDPYNVQIESVKNTDRYFKTNTTGLTLANGAWTGTTSTLSLQRLDYELQSASGYDQTALRITNATFMVVDDGNGNMRLMPRFDNSKVVDALTGTQITPLADATHHLTLELVPTIVSKSSDIKSMGGYYKLTSDFFIDESVGTSSSPFMGTIDGQLTPITGTWGAPLVAYAEDATIKNIVINYVSINETTANTNVGAIVSNALGETRIYNCGILDGSVSGTEYVGGLVGYLCDKEANKGSRVINCFSYADVSGGTVVGGIVGYNKFVSKATDIRTMVMNCMFYGDITGGSTVSPVYGGVNIDNLQGGLNTFNYYAYDKLKTKAITDYNCALAVEEKYLNRFEFYRLLLNSNKKLAAFYASKADATVNPGDMAKWVLETADRSISGRDPYPYPILKAQGYYPSIINYDVENADLLTLENGRPKEEDRNMGGKLGTLSVTISAPSGWPNKPSDAKLLNEDGTERETARTIELIRTDKDPDHFNFNYDKVQLPYYNDYGTKNYTSNKVVTGWKITAIDAVTDDPYTSSNYPTSGIKDYPDHNYADRKSSNKDLYSISGRVFSQGAYFDVPYGVTSITIEPYWGSAVYVADQCYDVVYKNDFSGKQQVTNTGTQVASDTKFNNQSVSNSINVSSLKGTTVYDNAVVLVGNLHLDGVPSNGDTPFTIMSVDEDNDHEPDYSLIYHHKGRLNVSPIRFDFLNVPGTSQAQRPNTASLACNVSIFKTKGWFEITNTALLYFSQFEYENLGTGDNNNNTGKKDGPLILQGGVFDQFVSTQSSKVNGKVYYIHVGGNVWFHEFGMGTHSDGGESTPHVPVSVTGGDYDGFYLTGTYNSNAAVRDDNAECYISGGRFKEVAGAAQEQLGGQKDDLTVATDNGNVHWQIYDADITEFYGGGVNDAKPVQGNITTDIFNSHVTTFCGGPKFGNMYANQAGTIKKTVTTKAEGCTFTKFFGAGYGGTSYSRKKYYDKEKYDFSSWQKDYYKPGGGDRGKYYDGVTTDAVSSQYGKKGVGVATDFDYEFFIWSKGNTGGRFFVKFASFSVAQCNDVESTLTNCTINDSFYGGGSLGKVTGTAKSVLDGCTVNGNVFGGGYSATLPSIEVRDAGFTKVPNYNANSGMFEPATLSGTTTFTWKNISEANPALQLDNGKIKNGTSGSNLTNHYVYTDQDLTTLGQVGHTDLTIKGNTYVHGMIYKYSDDGTTVVSSEHSGGVFGGGDESAVNGDTKVDIQGTDASGINNVYGGGNTADVVGSTTVSATGGKMIDVYGGGRGETTTVKGNVTVHIGKSFKEDGSVENTGTPSIDGSVYGGSAFGLVNEDNAENSLKETKVNIYGGTIGESVYGGGKGQVESGTSGNPDYKPAIAAQNYGNTTVNMEGGTVKAVYGGSNANGVLKNNSTVTITGGTVGTAPEEGQDIANVVFGGGYGQPTLVEGDVTVNIGTKSDDQTPVYTGNATINGHVYGGGALGNVNTSKPANDLVFDATKTTAVNLYKGTINGDAYGGGLGNAGTAAYVGGDVNVLLDGAKITGSIFGCNNVNGTPKGHVKVWVKRTVDSEKNTETDRDSRTTYDVAAVYGGGNQADYVPTDATLDPAIEGNPAKIAAACAEVLIEGCDLTSIEYVYGGGNAAAVPATDVTIKGSYIIDQVFGGGNGKSTNTFTNPGANVGIYKLNNTNTNYGSGKAVTKLYAGKIHQVFGGSNTLGNVRGGTSVTMPEKPSGYASPEYCEKLDVKEIYGAGQNAEQDGGVTMILGCVWGMKNVYGGAMNANVKGGVDLIITSGKFEKVFGGNDTSGTIQGPITVTIEETGCDPVEIDELYLGGNNAAYSVYGYKKDGDNLVARTSMTDGTAVNPPETNYSKTQLYRDPILNVVSCTRIGNVFGGGFGMGAIMYGNPTVNINMVPGYYADNMDLDNDGNEDDDKNAIGEIGNVYGGGSAADVIGNTTVNICTEPTVTVRTYMGAEIPEAEREPKNVLPAYITGDVFGAGKGDAGGVEYAKVTGNTNVVIGGGSIAKSVYGGGQLSQVGGNTNITVSGGTIGTAAEKLPEGVTSGAVYGNIYGGGFGHNDNVRFGLVKGNTNVTVTGGNVLHSVYGGGAYGSVGTYTYASENANAAISNRPDNNTGKATIHITGGTIGTNGHENGMVFGSSRGDIAAPDAIQDNMAWVYDTEVVIGKENDETAGPTIHGSLYGSGENGHTFHDASVKMYSGTVGNPAEFYAYRGNVYGGGCGTDKYYEDPANEKHDGKGTLYNPMAGIVKGNATVEIHGGSVANNIYGAGAMGKVEGNTSVIINTEGSVGVDGDHDDGNVYGAARGELGLGNDYASVTNSSVTITKGTVKGSVYGGGRAGVVTGRVAVQLDGGTVLHDVYGGGALAQVNTAYHSTEHPTYTTHVNLAGTTVNGNLYGGGLGQLASAGTAAVYTAVANGTTLTGGEKYYTSNTGAGEFTSNGTEVANGTNYYTLTTPAVAAQDAVAANVNGPVKVSVTKGSATNVFGCNNLNGAPQTTVDVEIGAKSGSDLSGSATVSGSVYGGGNMAAYAGSPAVKIYGGTVKTNVYGGGLGATAVTGGTSVTMEGGKVDNDVYGGGSQANVTGSVAVTIAGGTVTNDVYGGGALANTNTDNWDRAGSATTYVEVTDLATREYYSVISITVGQSVEGYYEFNGSTYVAATGTAVKGETYYQRLTSAPIAGYYTNSGDVYTLQTSGNAESGTTYYKKVVVGSWAEGKNNNETGTVNKTNVVLTGGSVGNVYGGGLGSSTVAANVYGDVKVTVNKPEELTSTGGTGIAFSYKSERVTFGEGDMSKEYVIPLTGRVFGCNNINGTPTGNVRVEVYSTRQADEDGKLISNTEHSPNSNNNRYEIQGVYGGGNLSDYLPAEGKATSVYIGECDVTSIEKVYGGGNSASVPTSNVIINGSFDLGYAFGGGNGGDLIKKDGVWYENAGAIVISQAYIAPIGGKIGAVFGGSDAKGNCGSIVIDKSQTNKDCPLRLLRLYGAGNEADVDNVNIIISGCSGGDNAEIEYVYGGSYNANVANDVNLTITAGKFKNIYGGNDRTGSIGGNIIVNIEETDNCMPITIQNLFGGGYQAPYPGTKRNGTEITTPGKITVNVKSATRIDNIYGGSFKADVNGDTEVNINMTKGWWAGKTYKDETIANSVGTIGNIYGGGNQGLVRGKSTVNIATATTVGYVTEPVHLRTSPDVPIAKGEGDLYYVPVTGARITGDVFGGGNEANVNGNATVNICTADYSGVTGFEGVSISNGSVYGGGSSADVLGNTNVTMRGGYVYDGVYGGGLKGSVGTFTRTTNVTTESNGFDHSTHSATCLGKPTACADGTGTCTVVVSGGQVGPVEVATKGMKNDGGDPVDVGFVFGAGRGDVENPNDVKDADFHTFVNKTDVTISGTALIMASVYGGGENGRVLHDTHVKIQGGQIGSGDTETVGGKTVPKVYTTDEWNGEDQSKFKECLSWDYKSPFLPHDPYAAAGDAEDAKVGTDGHTYYGSVFGGGSGYYPYKKADGTHEWLRSAGAVYGNTVIDITGGHILTCVYGGNETTDVGTYTNNDKGQPLVKVSGGKCTINMVGGTIGVPRTEQQMKDHPVTCYLFGAGKGDQRTYFNTWTNVQETEVNISGTARIFGSVFGGGEDGHILGDAKVNIGGEVKIDLNGDGDTDDTDETFTAQSLKIGTTGTSYVDGNVFGGGRGFSGLALTAGSTGGNAEVNIAGGTMLGSVYGGGRLASVGIGFTETTDPSYGQMVDDTNEKTHGHITVNISGGTIGNDVANAKYGGNVFGGSMGRITLLDGTLNPIWPKQAVTKDTEITITGNAIIKKNVYGGSEFGIVRDKAIVNIGGTRDKSTDVVTPSGTPTIHGSVFGAGYGSDDNTPTYITAGDYAPGADYVFTPMIWTGCVSGDTEVNIAGGTVKKNVYGGGEVASVGLINCHVVEDANGDITIGTKKYRYTNLTKHDDIQETGTNEKAYGFALSWPYKFEFIPGNPKSTYIGGKATVNVTGGHIGSTTWDDRTGYVFGGSKGQVAFKKKVGDELVDITDIHEQRYVEGLCANVRETEVNIKYSSTPSGKTPSNIGTEANCIMGAVYGGGEDGHVYNDAKVNITGGLIGLSVYGGGKGEGTYSGKLYALSTDAQGNLVAANTKSDVEKMPSWTAGKIYGNTSITMSNGHVMGNVYGGGNLGSVGKGNYAGGTDDYYPAGYGETLQNAPLWTKTAGFNPDAPITDSNKPTTMADYFLSSGKCKISITGGTVGTLNGLYGNVQGTSKGTPTGIVFGGSRGRSAQDVGALSPRYNYAPDFFLGYVNNTEVTIGTRNAETGPKIYSQVFGGARDGHVRGSAKVEINSGTIGQTYNETQEVGDADVDYQRYHRGNVYGAGSGLGTWDGTHHGTSSGSVTRNTTVDIYGGTIYNNVYGGGAMATVGPPKITKPDFAPEDWSKCTVNIYGGTIGDPTVYDTHKYGGTIYGGSRGDRGGAYNDLATGEAIDSYATVLWTEVNINPHPTDRTKDAVIAGNVYGGARGGQVKKDTKVNLLGGVIKHNAYGGGRGTTDIAADVLGNTTVELNKGVASSNKGCAVKKVFGCNDLNGTPKGHALVHVYATQKEGTAKIVPDVNKTAKFKKLSEYTSENYTASTNADDLKSLATSVGLTPAEISAHETAISGASGDAAKKAAIDNYIEAIADKKYDVLAVYGGGDLAPYNPTSSEEKTEVIIDGCEETSIKQVYGGGNAASAPATKVTINSAYEIHESFGGGNGKDDYVKDNVYYENSGADVGYTNYHHYVKSGEAGYDAGTHGTGAEATPYKPIPNNGTDDADVGAETAKANRIANYSYGTGVTRIEVFGGRIHRSYGGSNLKGNIRYETSSQYEESGACTMNIDETYGGSKDAKTDADIHTDMKCLDYTDELYGGSTSGDVNSNIVLNITNGTFKNVYGGNKEKGRIFGSITVNVKEMGCKPIIIGGLYAGGYKADYSIYGYSGTEHSTARSKAEYDALSDIDKAAITVQKDPRINVISATRIDNIYGGGFQARIVGNPHINVNMEEGTLAANYLKDHAEYLTNDQTDSRSGTTVTWRCREGALVESVGNDGILPIGTIGNIFGGGDQANIEGNTCIEIGTGKHHNDEGAEEVITPARNAAYITGRVYGGGNLGDVTGNTTVEMSNGYVADRIFGGGKEGNVGTVTATSKHTGDNTHDGCIGKPTAFAANTGKCSVTVSGGYVGPFTYSHLTGGEAKANVTITSMNMPDDHGYVFGAGRGELANPATDMDIDFRTYVKETEVIIKNTYEEAFEGDSLAHIVRSPLIAGGVYGGSENGRVLNNTHVNIWGGQIGLGDTKTAAYAEADFIDPTTATAEQIAAKAATMAECASWAYGHDSNSDGKNDEWLPYDEHAGNGSYQTATYGAASTTGYDGHTFYGNVFGGGSGYFTYETATEGVYEWLPSAGLVEGDTYVNISGGHILTNVYGGNEMTNVTGTTNVTMTGGTLGVPRTLAQIAAHPVTCYLFGAGKGDERVHFNKSTNVGHAKVNVSGGIIYGSIFGGGEDGHVLGNVDMNISGNAKIGTWGTSYVDGNVFGGGRGFSGDAYTAGNVAGSVTLNITGGTMLGSVYGGGRLGSVGYGLYAATEIETDGHKMYGEMQDDGYGDWYLDGTTYKRDAKEGFKRGHVEVNISGDNTVIGNKYEYQYISPETTGDALATAKTYLSSTQFESNNRLKHTRGGNVFAGGMGRYTKLDGTSPISTYDGSGNLTSPIEWKKLGNVKSTKLTISGNPWIMGNVYGGGEFGAVQGSHQRYNGNTPLVDAQSKPIVASTEILFSGGTIGTEITTTDPTKETIENTDARSNVQYTFGSIYGGGMGQETPDGTGNHGGDVKDSTYISMSKPGEATTLVRASVFGGGEVAIVEGNTRVNISGGEIGRNEVKPLTDPDAGYVLFGGATMGNVYGGGKGMLEHTEAGLVKGNTNVTISGGNVYHMVYGGGALGSVGTFKLSNGTDAPAYIPIAGVPYDWTANTGTATVNITGGTIGISGRDNGLVFGSSRGGLQKPTGTPAVDPYDKVAWVNKSVVTIGNPETPANLSTPLITCSVYGGGENGHNNESATVNVYSGTIGITNTEDPWYNFGTNETVRAKAQLNRGNVYGAGSGSDTYTDDSKEHYNQKSGMVGGNTFVNIAGGHIGRSVYGGGAMASVGTITSETKHESIVNGFGLSWPYAFEFAANTGKATVNVTGGHIGTRKLDGGDVYGSSRGVAGDRYEMAHLAFTNETEVNITYPSTIDMTSESAIQDDFTTQCITGSVHGSGENGYVYGDAKVTLNEGLIGHSLYGAGKGNGTYTKTLNKIGGSGTYDAKIYSLIAGKVMGNTEVIMNGGRVGRNVYGGGNMGSVGKGNYASGNDDYAYDSSIGAAQGYGEKIGGSLWTSTSEGDDAWQFLNSGKATVNVISGTVGYIDATNPENSMKNELPYGNVIGGSAGEAAPNIADDPRYEYSPAFFSGYVNETDVTIGGYRCKTAYDDYKVNDCITAKQYNALTGNQTNWELVGPTIYASVYGGGQDGHVRRDTKVTVLGGEIGIPYNDENRRKLKTNTLSQSEELDSPQWLHRGNIYGGGSGITKYKFDLDGDGKTDKNDGSLSYNGKPFKEEDYSTSSGSVTRFTEVHVLGGTIHRNVYGGGSMGSIGAPNMGQTYDPYKKGDTAEGHGIGRQSMNTVIIGGGTATATIGSPDDYKAHYGGEVYGACRGDATLDAEQFGTSIWTQVLIKNGANILGNVFGGGDAGKVKRDAEVIIGERKQNNP